MTPPDDAASRPPADTRARRAEQARDRYVAGLRRPRLIYAVVLTAVVAVFAALFATVWATGSAAHATLHTTDSVPADIGLASASQTQSIAWRSTDTAAAGDPQWKGTVVTFSAHTVGGRDARTGARTWSYTRTDRTVCAVGQLDGTTIAVFRRAGNCDEVQALASDTGDRRWARTLDQDGQPVDGTPAFTFTGQTFLVVTPGVVYSIYTVSGINNWTYSRFGCRIEHAVLGTSGLLLSQDCGAQVQCAKITYCGRGQQLLLRSLNAKGDTSQSNYDQITWNRLGDTGVPVSADGVVSARQPGGNVLDVHATAGSGAITARVRLGSSASSTVDTVPTGDGQLVWTGGRVYSVTSQADRPTWSDAAEALPTVVDGDVSRLTVVAGGQVRTLDTSGAITGRYTVAGLPVGATALPLGTGFLVSAAHATVVTR